MECPINELQTLRDYCRWTMSQLLAEGVYLGHGTDNAWDEALALILPSLHLPLSAPEAILDARLCSAEKKVLQKAIHLRLVKRRPTPYITHEAWFAGLSFYVDERVLIPRSPLGELIQDEFSPWVDGDKVVRVLDLCTGSGSLAIATAVYLPHVVVDAVDIDADALTVARRNVEHYQLQDRVRLLQSDVFDGLSPNEGYDIILSNPPYVPSDEYEGLPAEYHHEPRLALEAQEQGLAIVDRILCKAGDYLTQQGLLLVEVGNSEALVRERYPTLPLTWLSFKRGGQGVFLLEANHLNNR